MKTVVTILAGCFFLAGPNGWSQNSVQPARSQHWGIPYAVAAVPWEERMEDKNPNSHSTEYKPFAPNRLGKHRAVIRVPAKGKAAYLDLEWRRHDRNVARHWFFLVYRQTGDTVRNIFRRDVNDEHCRIVFGPVEQGEYFFYYLPFYLLEGAGAYGSGDPWDYYGTQPPPDSAWTKENNPAGTDPGRFIQASCLEIQSKTEFDSFYPMEVIATAAEKNSLRASNGNKKFMVFPEDRKYPIRMLDNIPQKWILNPPGNVFKGSAAQNEYYAFQLGVWALDSLADIRIEFSPLAGERFTLPPTAMTCFNTGGIDTHGKAFTKTVNAGKGHVQPMWIGLDLPRSIPAGHYRGKFTVRTANAGASEVSVDLTVTNDYLADRGDGEPWRHSRLRWLNSALGIDENPIAPYVPIKVSGNELDLSEKKVVLAESGLPKSINVFGEEVLSAPVQFDVETATGLLQWKGSRSKILKQTKNEYAQETSQRNGALQLVTHAEIESDGWMKYVFTLKALSDLDVADIRLTIPFRKENSIYMSGMDLYGAHTPDMHEAKWDTLFDAFWFGSSQAGLYCELRGAAYSGPILYWPAIREFYKLKPPQSWYNDNKGGYRIHTTGEQRAVVAYSGARTLRKGQELTFECAFIVSPVKKLDTRYQLTNRYYHNQMNPEPGDQQTGYGIQKVNLHHGNHRNQYINCPYTSYKEMKEFVDRCHDKGMKVKIYYTTRELTSMAPEIWAFRSLGNEILTGGPGGGWSWLRDHFGGDYTYVWYIVYGDLLPADAAIQTSVGMNRFYNYYIEDLKWLAKNVSMDGLYIDAAAYDRETVKRIKKSIASVRPECLLDLHEGQNSILRYLEFFPYLDKIWFGEGVDYEGSSPATWLISISGIPFGFIGDMLHMGGNPWRGMVYGMTQRFGWETYGLVMNPTNIWKVEDNFGIADARMVGYWDESPVVTTSDPHVMATAYIKEKKMLISVASWATEKKDVQLRIDLRAAGLSPDHAKIIAPAILDFQPAREFRLDESLPVEPGKGWMLVVEEK
jgi:hypothetical protein